VSIIALVAQSLVNFAAQVILLNNYDLPDTPAALLATAYIAVISDIT